MVQLVQDCLDIRQWNFAQDIRYIHLDTVYSSLKFHFTLSLNACTSRGYSK